MRINNITHAHILVAMKMWLEKIVNYRNNVAISDFRLNPKGELFAQIY